MPRAITRVGRFGGTSSFRVVYIRRKDAGIVRPLPLVFVGSILNVISNITARRTKAQELLKGFVYKQVQLSPARPSSPFLYQSCLGRHAFHQTHCSKHPPRTSPRCSLHTRLSRSSRPPPSRPRYPLSRLRNGRLSRSYGSATAPTTRAPGPSGSTRTKKGSTPRHALMTWEPLRRNRPASRTVDRSRAVPSPLPAA